MRKLKLDLNALQVETFDTRDDRLSPGTVAGFEDSVAGSYCVDCGTYTDGACGGCYSVNAGTFCDPGGTDPGPTADWNNAHCTFENCTANTWCYEGCSGFC